MYFFFNNIYSNFFLSANHVWMQKTDTRYFCLRLPEYMLHYYDINIELIFSLSVDCAPGTYIDGSKCTPCSYGTYQPSRAQATCLTCDPNKNTTYSGSVKKDDCKSKIYSLKTPKSFWGLLCKNVCAICKKIFIKNITLALLKMYVTM